jgi:hypothetical protein
MLKQLTFMEKGMTHSLPWGHRRGAKLWICGAALQLGKSWVQNLRYRRAVVMADGYAVTMCMQDSVVQDIISDVMLLWLRSYLRTRV